MRLPLIVEWACEKYSLNHQSLPISCFVPLSNPPPPPPPRQVEQRLPGPGRGRLYPPLQWVCPPLSPVVPSTPENLSHRHSNLRWLRGPSAQLCYRWAWVRIRPEFSSVTFLNLLHCSPCESVDLNWSLGSLKYTCISPCL